MNRKERRLLTHYPRSSFGRDELFADDRAPLRAGQRLLGELGALTGPKKKKKKK